MFRLTLVLITGFAWLLNFWLARHASAHPSVLGRWSAGYAAMLTCSFGAAIVLTICHAERVYRHLYAARLKITLLVASSILPVAGMEAFVRTFDLFGISYYEEAWRYELAKEPDDVLVFRHRENLDDSFQGVHVTTNEMGLREKPIGSKQPAEFRILILGDSVTFGWGVREEDTFPRRLEVNLGRELGVPVRVINSGVGSYNTEQELAFLRLRGPQIAPDLVLLLYVDNDIEINEPPWFRPHKETSLGGKSPDQAVRILLGRFWTYRLVAHVLEQRKEPRAPGAQPDVASLRNSAGWKRSMIALDGVAAYCRERQIPLAVFLYEHFPNAISIALRDDIAALATKIGFSYSSTLNWLSDPSPRSTTNSVVDGHPNSAGHELIERGMRDFLLEHRDLLPPSRGPG